MLCAAPALWAATREEDLAALRARIEALNSELQGREADRREARDALRASEAAISDANRALRALDAEARETREAIAQIAARRRALEATLAAQQEALGRLLAARALDRLSGTAPEIVRLALSGENPNDVARKLYYLSLLSRAAARIVEAHRAGLAELERLGSESASKVRELGTIEARQRADRERILAERRERRRVLERIAGDLRSAKKEMRTLLADEQRIARLIEEIGRVLADRPGAGYARGARSQAGRPAGQSPDADRAENPFSALRGKLAPPVPGELPGRFRTPIRAGATGLKGVFIRAREGDPVRAIAAGRVVYADWMRGFGNLLIVDHGEAYLSVYGNNESLLKQPGDAVAAGESIATVGASGGNEQSGLYFELRHLGKAFDPLSWLKRK